MPIEVTTPAVNAVARAAALRNSQFALNASTRKRKRVADSEDDDDDIDEDEDTNDDNTADAQLARALQEQEDAQFAANTMIDIMNKDHDNDELTPRRRTSRRVQKILPKVDFASDFEESDEDKPLAEIRKTNFPPVKRPKVELSTTTSNSVKFASKRKSKVVMDSDDSDEFVEIDDSMEDSEAPIPMGNPRPRGRMATKSSSSDLSKRASKASFKDPSFSSFRGTTSNFRMYPELKKGDTKGSASATLATLDSSLTEDELDASDYYSEMDDSDLDSLSEDDIPLDPSTSAPVLSRTQARQRINIAEHRHNRRGRMERARLETHHPELHTMWQDLENLPKIENVKIEQPKNINRELKPFQLEGVAWMRAMEQTEWGGGLLGDEMGMGKTIQAVSLIMSDWPAKQPSLVLIPPVALMQWQQEIAAYTDGTLRTFVYHGTNAQTKGVTMKDLCKYNVILMSYNSLESMYRKQEKGFKRKNGIHKEKSIIHQIKFHRVILDEAHNIKVCSLKHLSMCLLTNRSLATHNWFRKSLLRFEGRSQMVLVWYSTTESYR
jgi:DNA repair protein RAD16